jgi:hypothetical protein
MTDEQQLSRDLRALETDDDPNPAFADGLFAQLQDEAIGRRGPGRMWLMLAAAALIASLAVGAALGSGLVKLPFLIAEATATPQPSPSATATIEGTPSAEPTATPVPSPTPPATNAPTVGGVVQIVVTDLSLRDAPALDAERQGGLHGDGTPAYVVAGPVLADGYEWYQLAGLGIPPNSGCVTPPPEALDECPNWLGWVAGREEGGAYWIEPTSLVCPESPMNMETLAVARGSVERLACHGDRPITVRGWWPELPDGLGGACAGADHPSGWLYCQNINHGSLLVDETEPFGGLGLTVNLDPDAGVTMPERGQWIEIDGHFDDPAAQGCDEAAASGGDTDDPDRIVLTCRTHLVVDSARPVSGPF